MPDDFQFEIPADLTLGSQLCFAVHAASNLISDLYRPLLAQHDLTYAQYTALMALTEEDGVSITHLASRLRVAKATMTPLLRRLEGKELVTRRMEDDNERRKSIKITEKGRNLLGKSCPATDAVFRQTGLTPAQANELIGLCKIITGD
ncbi:MarR family winged helix-turn-helix transcriptional regulator [Roseovarius sp. EL26]|uniref:MarR family winged helix-turn-helix transcriptional regulator n=1 Tax=Roseovarius sp. EL26 TaxID=2126672 RepID=UPI001C1FF9CE|nr:MarR family transcriptional regulator [Roseovarius sp. EL26]